MVNWANRAPVVQIQTLRDSPEMPFVNRRLEVRFLSPVPTFQAPITACELLAPIWKETFLLSEAELYQALLNVLGKYGRLRKSRCSDKN
jgi:hypothetical protein